MKTHLVCRKLLQWCEQRGRLRSKSSGGNARVVKICIANHHIEHIKAHTIFQRFKTLQQILLAHTGSISTYHFSTLQDTATDLVGPYGKQRRLVCRADPRNGTLHAQVACASESLDRHTIQTALDRLALSPTRPRRVAHRAPVTRNNGPPDATTSSTFLMFPVFLYA